jgi:ribonuclease D
MTDATGPDPAEGEAPPPPAPLLELRDGLPAVVEDDDTLAGRAGDLQAGAGPVAVDAERASGYRYSSRAYLIQLRREGAGTVLVDPIAVTGLDPLVEALEGTEWILHAATQDLPCLREVGLRPTALFDTELAGRLLGYPRVGLATLVEEITGRRMRKEHSAVDWSRRPLPQPWLEYAALDVEVLIELKDALHEQLVAADKWEWARQEFEHLLAFTEAPTRSEPWRRTSGLHKVRGRRALAAVRELWTTRDRIARQRDVTPSRLLPDSALVAAATAMPTSSRALMAVSGFHGRGARPHLEEWARALETARALPEAELPPTSRRQEGPPPPRSWADKDPVAAARLATARQGLRELGEKLSVPVENLVAPDYVRRLMWQPPSPADVPGDLARLGARAWQIELSAPILASAIEEPAVGQGTEQGTEQSTEPH